jgi:hypothetical protein
MMKKDTEQTDILLSLLPIFVTPEDAAKWFKGEAPKVNYQKHGLQVLKDLEQWFYDARREANARVKATEDEAVAVAKRIPDNYSLEDWEKISLASLYSELHEAQEVNRQIVGAQKLLEGIPAKEQAINNKYALELKEAEKERDIQLKTLTETFDDKKEEITNRIASIDKEIQALEKRKAQLQIELNLMSISQEVDGLEKELAARAEAIGKAKAKELVQLAQEIKQAKLFLKVNTTIDIVPINNHCVETEQMKAFIPLAKEVESIRARLKTEEAQAAHYDWCVEAARKKPHELLQKVELPIEDLGVGGKGMVTIKGLPLSNLSTAQQVRACLNIARALAKETPLKLICVDKLEHLDETVRREFLKQIEDDTEWQYFITIVTDGALKVEAR